MPDLIMNLGNYTLDSKSLFSGHFFEIDPPIRIQGILLLEVLFGPVDHLCLHRSELIVWQTEKPWIVNETV